MEEIEIRGKLNKASFERLTKLFNKEGKLVSHYHRLSVDISPGFDPKTRSWPNLDLIDLRVKKSNEKEAIIIKVGDFNAKKRPEIEIKLKNGQIINALRLLESLGFNQGMIYFGQNWEYEYKGFEVKLVQYGDNYFNWEIESHDKNLDPDGLAEELKLHPFAREEYKKEIDWQNLNLHQLYSLKTVEKILKENFKDD